MTTTTHTRPLEGPCVAKPRYHPDGTPDPTYRGWAHMRCSHPTPPPAGYRRCNGGDQGCPFRLREGQTCYYHLEQNTLGDVEQARVRADWGGPRPIGSIWSLTS
jgi:hypothetical protein